MQEHSAFELLKLRVKMLEDEQRDAVSLNGDLCNMINSLEARIASLEEKKEG